MAIFPNTMSYFWALWSLGALYIVVKLARFSSREKHLPPGPPTWPIIGNVHLAVDKELYKRPSNMAPVFSLKIGKGTMVVLNSRKAVHDLIDKRVSIYLGRPQDDQFHTALKGESIANMDADAIWRSQKKVVVRFFGPSKLDGGELARISEAETTTLIYDLLQNPNDFSKHIHRATEPLSSIALYGLRAKSHDSLWVTAPYKALEALNAALSPDTYLPTEQFPVFNISTSIWKQAREHVEARRNQGDTRDSLMDDLLDGIEDSTNRDPAFQGTKLANFVGALMQAAAETSALAMRTNIMFLGTNLWVQEKAQKELNQVCGDGRMPTFTEDFKNLPVYQLYHEGGLTYTASYTDRYSTSLYRGHMMRGNVGHAIIVIPHWALSHSQYSNPDTYDPDRYLNYPGLATEYAHVEDRDHYTYGAGRRICTAYLLWAFQIEHAVDENTWKKFEIDIEAYDENLFSGPKPFKVIFVPRSEKHIQTIEKEIAAVKELLKKWE